MNGIAKRLVRKLLRARVSEKIVRELFQTRMYLRVSPVYEFFWRAFQVLHFNGIDGDYLEFGCARGGSFALAYRASRDVGMDCRLWAIDSFKGLPAPRGAKDAHPAWIEGRYSTGGSRRFREFCKSNGIPSEDYSIIEGLYEETLPPMSESDPPLNCCLVYIDCDLYSSTMTVLDFLQPRLKHGMIIGFDDYFTWSEERLSGERRACKEVFDDHPTWALVPYMQICWHGMAFVVENRALYSAASLDRV